MKKKDRNVVVILLLLILLIGVGYAILTTSLNINGTATVNSVGWDVHFNNVSVTNGSVATTSGNQATINGAGNAVNYTISLAEPGDFYEFTVDVVNNGTLDAKVSTTPVVSGVSTAQDVYINYSVKYSDSGSAVAANDTLGAGATKTLKVRVEFDKNITSSQLPTSNQTLTLTFPLTYIQA